jgi:hypothetical protein
VIDVGKILWETLVWGSGLIMIPWMIVNPRLLLDAFPAAYLGPDPEEGGTP